jgi:serine/threonine protein phosphatase 1
MVRTFAIGDIHGGCRALKQLLARVGLNQGDRLIFLGDYVDGWSESKQVIELLMELDKDFDCVFILGNHDMWCAEWLMGGRADPDWVKHGGQATIDSYIGISEQDREKHIQFFKRMRLFFEENDCLFIHAGFSSMHGPGREYDRSNYSWDRTLWEMALSVDPRIPRSSRYYPRRLLLYDEIFIGHTPTTNYDETAPMHRCNVWNLDTGAAFTGSISIMDVHSKRFWQSDVVHELYPGEVGRRK